MKGTEKIAPMRLSADSMREVEAALKSYWTEVEASDLSYSSQATYFDMANNFVRWMRGEFEPGSRKEPYRIKKDKPPGSVPA